MSEDRDKGNLPTGLAQDVWEEHRAIITRLYLDENKTLEEVRQRMSGLGFNASIQMYKKRITKWGIEKNLRRSEMLYVIHRIKERKREGKDSIVRIQDRFISEGEISRYMKRSGLLINDTPSEEDDVAVINRVEISTPSAEVMLCEPPAQCAGRRRRKPHKTKLRLRSASTTIGSEGRVCNGVTNYSARQFGRDDFDQLFSPSSSDRCYYYSAFDSVCCFNLCRDDIMSCLDTTQATLVCLQIHLKDFSSKDITATDNIWQLEGQLQKATENNRMGRTEIFWMHMQEVLDEIYFVMSTLDASTVLLVLRVIYWSTSLHQERGIDLSRYLYDMAEGLYAPTHHFVILISSIVRNLGSQLLAQAFLDIYEALEDSGPQGVNHQLTALRYYHSFAATTNASMFTLEVLQSFRSPAQQSPRACNFYWNTRLLVLIKLKKFLEADEAIDTWRNDLRFIKNDRLSVVDIIIIDSHAAFNLLRQGRYSECLQVLDKLWMLGLNSLGKDNFLVVYIASLYVSWDFDGPFVDEMPEEIHKRFGRDDEFEVHSIA